MSEILNIYCDESCHLENDGISKMGFGAFTCPKSFLPILKQDLLDLKRKHNLKDSFEIKWNKVSFSKIEFYYDLIQYYFDTDELGFRAVVIGDKSQLNHDKYDSNHDSFYYRMYYTLINKLLKGDVKTCIYLDKKDTIGSEKTKKLHDVLCRSNYDFDKNIISKVQIESSHKVVGIQIADFLLGAIIYSQRELQTSEGKLRIVQFLKEISGKELDRNTLMTEKKINLLCWKSNN